MSSTPIADHALLSDRHGLALLDRAGTVVWWCPARPDSPAVFARLLDDAAGHWTVRPHGLTGSTRRYLDNTLLLETTVTTPTGTLVQLDGLLMGEGDREHDLGVDSPHVLVRRLACTAGAVEVDVEFAPRPEYGVVHPQLEPLPSGLASRGGADRLVLTCPEPLTVDGATARGRLRLAAGDVRHLALHAGGIAGPTARVWSQDELTQRLDDTIAAWRSWSQLHQRYEGPYAEQVHLAGRVLQALSYQPTGAVVAAATVGLPEQVGGARNWDYRYTWVRDAAMTLQALWVAACPDEAAGFFTFLATAAAGALGAGQHLPVMLGVGGERDLTPRTLEHLAGWRGSRPVTVGNGAWSQAQIDVYGELLGAAHRLREQLGDLDQATRAFLVDCADAAARRWQESDQGLWESRGKAQHYTYSKVMCWVALDRAIQLADLLHAADRVPAWQAAQQQVHDAVTEHGWNERAGAYTQAFGSEELDASVLVLPIVGFLPADDPRMLRTLDAVAERLTDTRGLVRRYDTTSGHDGLDGEEGTFLLCTFWLAEAQALAGDVDAADHTLRRALDSASDLGLLSEEVHPDTGEQLGNTPQAFSHIGLVNAAHALHQARRRGSHPDPEPDPRRPSASPAARPALSSGRGVQQPVQG